jgi:hypothetical protein
MNHNISKVKLFFLLYFGRVRAIKLEQLESLLNQIKNNWTNDNQVSQLQTLRSVDITSSPMNFEL